jgi:hypothetical protein
MRRRIMVLFLAVQLVGMLCAWLQHAPSVASSFLWGAGFLLLFPGDLLSALIVERLLWHSNLSLASMTAVTAVLLVVINAIIWLVVWKIVLVIHARVFARVDARTPSSPKPNRV